MGNRPPFDNPCRVEVTAAFPIPQSWPLWRQKAAREGREWATANIDADNILKAIGDAFNEVIWRDDRQIVAVSIAKVYSEKPEVVIVVEPLAVLERPRTRARPAVESAPLFALERPP